MQNIEIKAICNDLDRTRQIALELNAQYTSTIKQIDTYFKVPAGRLKLREQVPGRHQLIYYNRPDEKAPKMSDYQVVSVDDPAGMRNLLSDSLGVLIEVQKQRELWLFENVRIHLDSVDDLGNYIEFEIIVNANRSEDFCYRLAENLVREFGVREEELESGSYSDLLSQTKIK